MVFVRGEIDPLWDQGHWQKIMKLESVVIIVMNVEGKSKLPGWKTKIDGRGEMVDKISGAL